MSHLTAANESHDNRNRCAFYLAHIILGMHCHGHVTTRPMTIMRLRWDADRPSWHFPFTDNDLQLTVCITRRASFSVLHYRLFADIVWLPASQNCSYMHVPSNYWITAYWTLDSQHTHAKKEIDSENATREHQETLQLNRIIQPFFHMNVQRLPGNALWFDNVFGPTATTNLQCTRDVCDTFLLCRLMMAVRCSLFSSVLDPRVIHCSGLVVSWYTTIKNRLKNMEYTSEEESQDITWVILSHIPCIWR